MYDFSGLPLPYIIESPNTPAQALADLMGLSLEELLTLNAMTSSKSIGDLPAGLALQALGQPAVPPLPTVVRVKSTAELVAFAAAYGIAMADMQTVGLSSVDNNLSRRLLRPTRCCPCSDWLAPQHCRSPSLRTTSPSPPAPPLQPHVHSQEKRW